MPDRRLVAGLDRRLEAAEVGPHGAAHATVLVMLALRPVDALYL
jgi:hypothetical protein